MTVTIEHRSRADARFSMDVVWVFLGSAEFRGGTGMAKTDRRKLNRTYILSYFKELVMSTQLSEAGRVASHLHPLFLDVDSIGTVALDELYMTFRIALETGASSVAVAAPTGTGKSRAIARLQLSFEQDYRNIPIVIYNTLNLQQPSIRGFFKHFLYTLGHEKTSGETGDLRERVVNFLVDAARQAGSSTVILMVDEAQVMKESDVFFLKDVYNELRQKRVRLLTFMFGEGPKFCNHADGWTTDVKARFVAHKATLRGMSSLADIERVLDEIDNASFSVGSDQTWTSSLFPRAWQGGFRLHGQAMPLLESITKATRGKVSQFPTREVFAAIRALIRAHWDKDAPDMSIGETAWPHAVAYAQVAEAASALSQDYERGWNLRV